MEEMQTVIILMTVVIIIHSVMIVALFGIMIALLVKIKKIAGQVETTTKNLAHATEWLSPVKVFNSAFSAFKRFRK